MSNKLPDAAKHKLPGRPQQSDVSDRILKTALVILGAEGFRGMRIEDVAMAAATSKQAIYRRWSDKSELAAVAIEYSLQQANPTVPDTGNLVEDLIEVLSNTVKAIEGGGLGQAVAACIGEQHDPCLKAAVKRVDASRRLLMRAVFESGIARGDLPTDRDIETDIDMLLGMLYFRKLFRHQVVNRETVRLLVVQWAAGV